MLGMFLYLFRLTREIGEIPGFNKRTSDKSDEREIETSKASSQLKSCQLSF